ncbi:MAG: hypothetical protein MZU95_14925 [Desulfomicrobium escambiense]|nr:hypothetical protein [Desulfomicrobium escambiense]
MDFEAYAEAAVSQAAWARSKEWPALHRLRPAQRDEPRLPRGPGLRDADVVTAVRAVAKRMDAARLGDVKLVVACDAPPVSMDRFGPMLEAKDLVGRVLAFLDPHLRGRGRGRCDAPVVRRRVRAERPREGGREEPARRGPPVDDGVRGPRPERPRRVAVRPALGTAPAPDARGRLPRGDRVGRLRQPARARLPVGDLRAPEDRPLDLDLRAEEALLRGEAGLPLRTSRVAPRGRRRSPARPEERVRGVAGPDAAPPARGLRFGRRSRRHARRDEPGRGRRRSGREPEGASAAGAEARLVSYLRTTRTEDARLVEQKPAAGGTVRITVPEGSIFTLTTDASARPPSR